MAREGPLAGSRCCAIEAAGAAVLRAGMHVQAGSSKWKTRPCASDAPAAQPWRRRRMLWGSGMQSSRIGCGVQARVTTRAAWPAQHRPCQLSCGSSLRHPRQRCAPVHQELGGGHLRAAEFLGQQAGKLSEACSCSLPSQRVGVRRGKVQRGRQPRRRSSASLHALICALDVFNHARWHVGDEYVSKG